MALRLAVVNESDTITAAGELIGEPLGGVLTLEETETGDGRLFKAGAWVWRDLPLPLYGQDRITYGHNDAVLCGQIAEITRVGNEIRFAGHWLKTSDGDHFREINEYLNGVSVDYDDVAYRYVMTEEAWDAEQERAKLYDADPDSVFEPERTESGDVILYEEKRGAYREEATYAEIMGATILGHPAFREAFALTTAASDTDDTDDVEQEVEVDEALAASIVCSSNAPRGLSGWVATRSKPSAIVASIAAPMNPPKEWFADPKFDQATACTVTDDGRFYGHVALHSSCHIGYSDECVTPPLSASNYAHFLTGEIKTAEGDRVPVGQITMNTGHADPRLKQAATVAHYDDTGTAAVDIAVGEDEYGIWAAGAIRPDLTELQVRALMAADVSGDWRRIDGNLEMVGVLSVNVPGFGKSRLAASAAIMSMHKVDGLVASLSLSAPPELSCGRDGAAPASSSVRERIASSVGRGRQVRRDEIAARVRS